MPANIIELDIYQSRISGGTQLARGLTKPSGVMSVEASPPGVSLESTIIHDGPFCVLIEHWLWYMSNSEIAPVDGGVLKLLDQLDQHQ